MSYVATIHEIYQAFGRGDIPSILGALSDSVEWEYGASSTDVPWIQRRTGKEGAQAFFASLAALDFHRFEVKHVLGEGSLVVGLVDVEATVKATGKSFREEDEVHLWWFDEEGKVARFAHRMDTHQHHLAFHG